jgi:hypothetical protein
LADANPSLVVNFHIRPWGCSQLVNLKRIGEQVYILNNKPTRLMSQMIRYRNRDKGVSIKLENPMTERHGLDVIKKLHLRLLMLTE